VIEFALLFGLGFLTALLIAMLLAPAIHRRIVSYTENRIRATVPISPQEVRAQRDMVRALYAAENARTKQELVQERDKTVALQLKGETFRDEIKSLVAENLELKTTLDNLDNSAADLRSQLRQEDGYIAELKMALETSEEASVAKDLEIEDLRQQLDVLAANNDNARIDLSTRETEIENLKFRISTLREEREALRQDVRLQTTRAKDAENRLAHEEHRAMRLEDKLAKEISNRSDKENALELRNEEIARLRDKVKGRAKPAAPAEGPEEVAAAEPAAEREALAPITLGEAEAAATGAALLRPQAADADVEGRIASLSSDARNRATALSERLLNGKSSGNDEALRQEMASIAAEMVAMTALSEGRSSPIHAMIAGKPSAAKRQSLATRVRSLMSTAGDTAGR
jgi:chromosome segregation ATPase